MLKQKDFAAIILVAAVSFAISFFVADFLISTPEDREEAVQDVSSISSEAPSIDRQIFHGKAVNPAEDISIGDSSSDNPFTGGSD